MWHSREGNWRLSSEQLAGLHEPAPESEVPQCLQCAEPMGAEDGCLVCGCCDLCCECEVE